jgi:hypothetical protein
MGVGENYFTTFELMVIKPKKCKYCKSDFTPFRTTQSVCGLKCSVELAKIKQSKVEMNKAKVEIEVLKLKVKTHSDWRKELQIVINSIVREIDKGSCCISSLRPLNPKFDAGHRFSVGSSANISFNLFNIFSQSVHENQYKSGNPDGFDNGLKNIYGVAVYNKVHSLKLTYKDLIVDTETIKMALPIAKSILKQLKADNKVYSVTERIQLRERFNAEIGIY